MPDKYSNASDERNDLVEKLVASPSKKKVVVAGPGTGKTYLFRDLLSQRKKTLTLTFVNSLVEDLSLELCGLSEVRTLHSYARSILTNCTGKNIKIHSKLSSIIRDDAKAILDQDINFDWIFNQRDESNKDLLEFYKQRRKYYNYYGFSDIIYTAVLYFEMDEKRIPQYDQVVVDEFQDFNKLEVDLINLLAKQSPILLAGDDDQALYQFKGSSNQFIRDRYIDTNKDGYDPFNLPFCARCPKVIVDATNDFIESAKTNGHLMNRIDKPFKYFDCPSKDKISQQFPSINYKHVFERQIPWFIEKTIADLARDIKGKFSVLIIAPYSKKVIPICNSLKDKGLQNIDYESKENNKVEIIEGFKILLANRHDNLGWRIVSESMMHPMEFQELLRKNYTEPDKNFEDILPTVHTKNIKQLLSIINYINKKKPVSEESLSILCKALGLNQQELISNHLRCLLDESKIPTCTPEIRKIPIKGTTIQSAKGLSADIVFITHFDDQYFIQNRDNKTISDQDICNFLVSITRAKQSLFLISTVETRPIFLDWISKDRINFM